jgi:hypothetical protein
LRRALLASCLSVWGLVQHIDSGPERFFHDFHLHCCYAFHCAGVALAAAEAQQIFASVTVGMNRKAVFIFFSLGDQTVIK